MDPATPRCEGGAEPPPSEEELVVRNMAGHGLGPSEWLKGLELGHCRVYN